MLTYLKTFCQFLKLLAEKNKEALQKADITKCPLRDWNFIFRWMSVSRVFGGISNGMGSYEQ